MIKQKITPIIRVIFNIYAVNTFYLKEAEYAAAISSNSASVMFTLFSLN